MSWTLTVGIDKFILTDQEKEFYLQAINAGEKHIQVKRGLFVGTNYQSLVENNTENPILNNPNWIELQSLPRDDEHMRRIMRLEHAIGVQFPYERFVNEWEEVYRYGETTKKLTDGSKFIQ